MLMMIRWLLLILYYSVCLAQKTPPPSPTSLTATATSTSITLTWTHPEPTDLVHRYVITYTYVVRGCSGVNPEVNVSVNGSSVRSHTIQNNLETPIEEDSVYNITLVAVNDAGILSNTISTTVQTFQAAPSGSPQSLRIASVGIFSAVIQWERVECMLRNGNIYGYRASYYPTSDNSDVTSTVIVGTRQDVRSLTMTRLQPRTSYVFEVVAINLATLTFGPLASITVLTKVPDNVTFALNGALYGNNSIVTITDIGDEVHSALLCITNNRGCCDSGESGGTNGILWYLPKGMPVNRSGLSFYQNAGSSVLRLFRKRGATSPNGIFHCQVPDASGTQKHIFIGVYPSNAGSPSVVLLALNQQESALVCVSSGGPATTVVWKKDNSSLIEVNNTDYQHIQTAVNTETATYENKLISNNTANFVGTFTCIVINVRGSAENSITLNGPRLVLSVQSFCSVIVWSNQQLQCDDIMGYEVRLYNPYSGQEVYHQVGRLSAHYIVTDEDKIQVELEEAYVQVRVLHSFFGPREWSEDILLGCGPSKPKPEGIHFLLGGQLYSNNSRINLHSIGENENGLVCKTDLANCCGTLPNRFGEFYYPNGVQVPIKKHGHGFYRDRGEQEIRLHRREGVTTPVGRFRCQIPDARGDLQTIYIELVIA